MNDRKKKVSGLGSFSTGTGEPVLMIHGIISDASFFSGISEILVKNHQIITYDRRGYGLNETSEGEDYSVAAQAEDAAEVLKAFTEEPAWILGNSAGGLIAVELCLRHPELVKGMILLEPSLIFDEDSGALMDAWNKELNGYLDQKKIKKAIVAFSRITGQGPAQVNSGSLEEMKQTYKNLSAFMYGELNEVQTYRPPLEEVSRISVPVRILVSEEGKDTIFGITSRRGAETLNWPVIRLPGYHNTVKDHPAEAAECVERIIKEERSAAYGT